MTHKILYFVFAITLLIGGTAYAQDTLTCGVKIIDVGMTMEEVSKHCGKPDSGIIDDQPIHTGNRFGGTTEVTTWRYIQPGGLIIAVLVFDVDKLQSIEYVDKFDE
jgi:hypothetical protein